ncbi:MAG: 7-carboxy-7-deazaguanine synthase QueE [Gammaproteobacteria bacterium]
MASVTAMQAAPTDIATAELRISEIFFSIQGESSKTGLPTVFIRLTGCPLRCHYCDTAYAFHGGHKLTLAAVLDQVRSWNTAHVTVTGGEPLAQKNCLPLLTALCNAGYAVSLETSGAIDTRAVDARVMKILDLKTPGSGEVDRNFYPNLAALTPQDQIKFVICDRADYDWACKQLNEHDLLQHQVLFSPSHDQLPALILAEWILADQLPVRLQVQLHKYLWGDQAGH